PGPCGADMKRRRAAAVVRCERENLMPDGREKNFQNVADVQRTQTHGRMEAVVSDPNVPTGTETATNKRPTGITNKAKPSELRADSDHAVDNRAGRRNSCQTTRRTAFRRLLP